MAACEITLNDWMFRAIVKDRRVLTINNGYFGPDHGPEAPALRARAQALRASGALGDRPAAADREMRLGARAALLQAAAAEGRRGRRPARLPRRDELRSQGQGPRPDDDGMDARRWATNERILVTLLAAGAGAPRAHPGRPPDSVHRSALVPGMSPGTLGRRRSRNAPDSVHRSRPATRGASAGVRYIVHNPQAAPSDARTAGAIGTSFTKTRYIVHGSIRYIVHAKLGTSFTLRA